MPEENDSNSRLNRFEKRRKNTKIISLLIALGCILIILLIGFWLFGGNEGEQSNEQETETTTKESENSQSNSKNNSGSSSDQDSDNNQDEDEGENPSDSDSEDAAIEELETPDDDNIVEAYQGDWKPVGTEQEGPHQTTFQQDSQDWKEIMEAVSLATELNQGDMVQHWVGNGGDQKVIATVSNSTKSEHYRVYVSWVENQGWKPTKVEVLKEVDINN